MRNLAILPKKTSNSFYKGGKYLYIVKNAVPKLANGNSANSIVVITGIPLTDKVDKSQKYEGYRKIFIHLLDKLNIEALTEYIGQIYSTTFTPVTQSIVQKDVNEMVEYLRISQ